MLRSCTWILEGVQGKFSWFYLSYVYFLITKKVRMDLRRLDQQPLASRQGAGATCLECVLLNYLAPEVVGGARAALRPKHSSQFSHSGRQIQT